MPALKKPIEVETAFETYQLTDQLGEGGAGRVYGGVDSGGKPIALKVLTTEGRDKRKRFKNEIAFLARNRHPNIVTVTDHGVAAAGSIKGPFYVMARYTGCLRDELTKRPSPARAMELFSQILDGVEAAHLVGTTHRDLKPENVLIDAKGSAAIADFGVAQFAVDDLHTFIETAPTTRLANFQYAAPEQRRAGQKVGPAVDIYALGLMLNELFTGTVPHGTSYGLIASASEEYGFLDVAVGEMIRHSPSERPATIEAVKILIQKYKAEAVSLQKLRALDKVVIPAGEITDPLAFTPPKIIGVDYRDRMLTLQLDQTISTGWEQVLKYELGNFTSVMGIPPSSFQFQGDFARVGCEGHSAQRVIDYFKNWLPQATAIYKYKVENQLQLEEQKRRAKLQEERQNEELRMKLNSSLTF